LEHKKEPLNPQFPGENQQETLHLTLIMALVLGSGFLRKTTQLFPYFNYYYLKAAVPMYGVSMSICYEHFDPKLSL
jgi:hypothetical protein